MQDPTYPLFPIFSFLGFFISLLPLTWHLQSWNAGTCAFMIWASLGCLVGFVNSIVWNGNLDNVAPIWCDISSKFIVGAGVAIPAASLCISRRLYKIASVQTVSISHGDKRRAVIVDLCISVGIPFLVMILHYIVQGHRFNILEDVGCFPATVNTLPAYFLVLLWPVGLGFVSFVYSVLTLRCFWIRRMQFSEFASSNNSMNVSRYIRLMVFAMTDMMCNLPFSIYSIYVGTLGVQLAPWVSWSDTHFHFSRVDLIPSLIWRSDPHFLTSVELTRWIFPISAFLFFGLFGFATEAKKNYRLAFWWVARRFGFRPASTKSSNSSHGWRKPVTAGPTVYVPASPIHKKHRIDSFTSSLADSHGDIDLDLEKFAGLSSQSFPSPTSTVPPEYSHQHRVSEPHRLEAVADDVVTIAVSTDSLPLTRTPSRRPLSPAPFQDVTLPPSPRPFSSTDSDESTVPSDRGILCVMVHTETTETV